MTEHPFAPFVRILGRGKKARRDLTRDEAFQAFTCILNDQVTPAQAGAFLMLLRVKEETPEELAGFIDACRQWIRHNHEPAATQPYIDLDWPTYSGKKKQAPWYILSALLLASRDIKVLLHGGDHHTPERLYCDTVFHELSLPVASSLDNAIQHLAHSQITFLHLRHICPALDKLLAMRFEMGLRSPVNTLVRNLNPLDARLSLQSVFHPAYIVRHLDAASLLGDENIIIFKGEGGEIEIRPDAHSYIAGLRNSMPFSYDMPSSLSRQHPDTQVTASSLIALWRGEISHAYGEHAIISTAAVALAGLQPELSLEQALIQARSWWDQRDRSLLG